jgi:hypothetical protein
MEIVHRYHQLEALVRRYGDETATGFRCSRPILARAAEHDDAPGCTYLDTTTRLTASDNLIRLVHYAPGSNTPHLEDFRILAATSKRPATLQRDSYDLNGDKRVRVERTLVPVQPDGSAGPTRVKRFKWQPGMKPFPWKSLGRTAAFLAATPAAVAVAAAFIPQTAGAALAFGLLGGGIALSAGVAMLDARRQHLPRQDMLSRLGYSVAWGAMSSMFTALNPLFGLGMVAAGTVVAYGIKRDSLFDYYGNPYVGLARKPQEARQSWIAPPRAEWVGVKPAAAPVSAAGVNDYLIGV